MSQTTLAGRYALATQVDHTADGATVHQATDRQLTRPVSVTIVPAASAALTAVAGAVEHRHLLPVHEFGTYKGTAYLVSEPYADKDLFDTAGQIRVADPSFVRSLVRQLAAALDALAARDLVHLGIDPLAIRLDPSIHPADPGTVRLGRLHALQPAGATGVMPLAEPSYVAPELEASAHHDGGPDRLAESAVDPAADRWALAALAFTLLTGQAPFPISEAMSVSETTKVRDAKAAGDVPPVARVRPSERRPVPVAVDAVLRTAMAPDPAQRLGTASEFAEAFARACDEVAVVPDDRDDESQPRKRKKSLIIVGALVVVLLVGLATWRLMRDDPAAETGSGLPAAYRFVQPPLATGCGAAEPPEGRFVGAEDVLRCTSGGTVDEVELVRYASIKDRDRAVDRLLDERIGQLVTCSDPPLAPDSDAPSAVACFEPDGGGAELAWVVGGRPVLATASTNDGTPAALEVWLRQVAPNLIEEG